MSGTDYGTVRVTVHAFRDLVNAYFPYDPDTLAIHPLAAEALRQDRAASGRDLRPLDRIEGCPLLIDDRLAADRWELRHGSDVLASGCARAPA